MSIDRNKIARAVARHGRIARVVVAEARGSAPREPGAAMLVWANGQAGTIGGGALEFEAASVARQTLADGRDRLTRCPLGPALGQCCGGAVVLATEVWDTGRLSHLHGPAYLRRLEGPADAPLSLRRAATEARNAGTLARTQLAAGWLIEPVETPAQPLWIYGAGHVGRALISVLAPLPDYTVTWIDTALDRFPDTIPDGITQLIAAKPADSVHHAPAQAHHLILTYSHALDLELCHRLLSHGFGEAGLIGSATKWERFRKRLAALGHTDAQISRIRCPIGQKHLGKHPQAIAVGVAAELLSQAGMVQQQREKRG